MHLRQLATCHGSAFALDLRAEGRFASLPVSLGLYSLHFIGLLATVRLTHQPLWLALFPLLLVQPLAISLRLGKFILIPESLAPLAIPYGVLTLRVILALAARVQGFTSDYLAVPEPWGALLDLKVATAMGGLWALAAQATALASALGRPPRWAVRLGQLVALLTFVWAAMAYTTVRTHGATGSDPYAYVQMAVDLAQRGTPLHTFDLAPLVESWGLPLWPVVPVGYRPPDPESGLSATVWPPGYSAPLALAFRLGGEPALYLLTPLLGLAALGAMWWLSLEVTRGWASQRRFQAAGVAVLLLGTSYEEIDRLAVPMADVPAQLFSVLAVAAAMASARRRNLWLAALSGLCLGTAFAIRYTQLLMAFAVVAAFSSVCSVASKGTKARREQAGGSRWRLTRGRPGMFSLLAACYSLCASCPRAFVVKDSRRLDSPSWSLLVASAVAAWIPALPVLAYHQVAFGSPFSVGSSELALFGWEQIPSTLATLLAGFLRPNEFAFLLPFLLWGARQLWQDLRLAAVVLAAWLVPLLLFHLPYPALRLRDLLPLFPVLALVSGVGVADWLHRVSNSRPERKAGAWAVTILLLWFRTVAVLGATAQGADFGSFGYLRTDQRAAFEDLRASTPPEAVVAASLNHGPILLYSHRSAVRPAYWTEAEWLEFVERARAAGRPVYLLIDGDEMEGPLNSVRSRYRLDQVISLPMPYFSNDGGSENRDVPLYRMSRELGPHPSTDEGSAH